MKKEERGKTSAFVCDGERRLWGISPFKNNMSFSYRTANAFLG